MPSLIYIAVDISSIYSIKISCHLSASEAFFLALFSPCPAPYAATWAVPWRKLILLAHRTQPVP